MNVTPNDIVLRPRFQLELSQSKEQVLDILEKSEKYPFLVKRIDEHVFIKFNIKHNHFWSPQLHLEIEEIKKDKAKLYGVFGPNPALWTFFMFLHFGVATTFILLGIWAYSNSALNKPYEIQMGSMVFLVVLWFILYAFGSAGKRKGKPQMHELYDFISEILIIS